MAYLLGLLRTLATYRPPVFQATAEGRQLDGRFLLALASLGPRCGGGMRLTPGAAVDDGLFDLLLLDPLTLPAALARLPRLFDGGLAGDPAFHITRCRGASIAADPPCGVELDGQLFGTTPVTISILPGAISALDCRPDPARNRPDISEMPGGSVRAYPRPDRAARMARN
jgi:diacylglycerol kinase (ATP)